jgi:Asp/Glu/hydantoin racemase
MTAAEAKAVTRQSADYPSIGLCLDYIKACAHLGQNGCVITSVENAEVAKLLELGYDVKRSGWGAIVRW